MSLLLYQRSVCDRQSCLQELRWRDRGVPGSRYFGRWSPGEEVRPTERPARPQVASGWRGGTVWRRGGGVFRMFTPGETHQQVSTVSSNNNKITNSNKNYWIQTPKILKVHLTDGCRRSPALPSSPMLGTVFRQTFNLFTRDVFII